MNNIIELNLGWSIQKCGHLYARLRGNENLI